MALLPPPLGYLCCDSAPCLESSRPFPAPTPRTRPAPPPSGSSQSKTYPRTRVAAQLMGRRGTTTPGVSCGGSPCAPSALCWPCCGGCKPHPCREAPSTAHAWRRRGRPYLAGKLGAGSTAPHGIRVPFTLRLCCGTGSHPHVVPAGGGVAAGIAWGGGAAGTPDLEGSGHPCSPRSVGGGGFVGVPPPAPLSHGVGLCAVRLWCLLPLRDPHCAPNVGTLGQLQCCRHPLPHSPRTRLTAASS